MTHSATTAGVTRGLRARARYIIGRGSPVHMVGLMVVLGLVVAAVFAPCLAMHDPLLQDVRRRLGPPVWSPGGTWDHPLGTDQLGRDLLSRLIYGSRISLLVGFFSVVVGGLIGVSAGLVSGFLGGIHDVIVMGVADAQLAFPFILLALAVMVALGPGLRNVIIVLALSGWVVFARLVRGITLSVKEKDFVEAARSYGAGSGRIMLRHVLPHVLSPVIVLANLQLGFLILAEAALSFLGLGLNPPTPTWGNMISDGRNYVWDAPWLSIFPGIALVFTVLGFTYFGDWLRMRLDPKYRGAGWS
ncbi:MAG: ABC transporter permease [Armatimonadota bacterium]